MKIVFIGAGMAALTAGERLGKAGYEVEIYEKKSYDELSYDWHDDVNGDAFKMFGLPMPAEGTYFRKKNWTFIPPSERNAVQLNIPEEKLDFSIERRPLAKQYADRAKLCAKLFFDTEVESLMIENKKVRGVIVGGKKIYADLVVDNSGALSEFRASLPAEYGITSMPEKDEIFVAYRGFHKRASNAPDPKYSNKVYLKHMGEVGISWCISDVSGVVNVLIGRIGELHNTTLKDAYSQLKARNQIIDDEILRGGVICVIPVRYPLTRMVGDGYAAIGDAAFMTIPMLGSGIENSMKAACILADTIIEYKSVSAKILWRYQTRYYKLCGAKHLGIDVLKRWLLSAPPSDLDFLFEREIIDNKDLIAGATGNLLEISFADMIRKASKGISKIGLLLRLNSVLNKTKKAEKYGKAIPDVYDERAIRDWENKIDSLL